MLTIIKFRFLNQFQIFLYKTVCVFSKIIDKKHIEFSFCRLRHASWWDLGVLGVKTFSVGICNGAPSYACSRLNLIELSYNNVYKCFK